MSERNRGAAQVSVMWIIALSVLLIFAALFAWLSYQQVADLERQRDAVLGQRTAAEERASQESAAMVDLSTVVGHVPPGSASGKAEKSGVSAQLDELKNTFPAAAAARTMQEAAAGAISDYGAALREKNDLSNQVERLRNELQAHQTQHQATIREKDSALAAARRETEDLRNTLNGQVVDLERQRDGLREQVRDQDRALSELRSRMEEQGREFVATSQVDKQRRDILSSQLNEVARRAETPDGTVLASNSGLGKAWVDLGRLNRVRAGMEFDVLNPMNGALKGRLRILSVEERRSESLIVREVDRYDPITSSDQIRNAVYDPARQTLAVLLGNGFGKFSADDMKVKLAEIGVLVAPEVTNEVDYLILGTPFFDEETGDPVPWSSRDEYKAAEALSLQILPLRDVMAWLGL